MTSVRSISIAVALICSAHGANAMPLPSTAHFGVGVDPRSSMWMPVRLCNGISKHTRTICCGTRPPAWCGKPQGATEVNTNSVHKDAPLEPLASKSDSGVMSILGDPMLYVCLMACVTIISLVALAGSGRDQGVEDAV